MRDNPNLSPGQIYRIWSVAQLPPVQAGEVLCEPSQLDVPFFIALEGSVAISSIGEDDKTLGPRSQRVHRRDVGHFRQSLDPQGARHCRWLPPGEMIIAEVQGIGQLINPVIAERNDSSSRFFCRHNFICGVTLLRLQQRNL